MKRILLPIWLVFLFITGCGVDWFPSGTTTNTNTTSAPILTRSFSPGGILSGGDTTVFGESSTLTFTIVNATGNSAASGLGFTDTLPSGITIAAASSSQCGGTVSTSGSQLVFSGGSLAAGPTSCTVTATVTSTAAGSYANKTADITALKGGLQNGVTDETFTVFPSTVTSGSVTASNLVFYVAAVDSTTSTYSITVDTTNSGTTDANVQVNVIAVDAQGADIVSTSTTLPDATTFQTVPAGTDSTAPVQFFGLPAVPNADAHNILFWRIVSITVQ